MPATDAPAGLFWAPPAAAAAAAAPCVLPPGVAVAAMDFAAPEATWLRAFPAREVLRDASVYARAPAADAPVALDACLDAFEAPEQLQADNLWACPTCRAPRAATKQLQLWALPRVLVLHLKRFRFSAHAREKVRTLVTFPTDGLDLAARVLGPGGAAGGAGAVYDLFAVTHHTGSLAGGHCTWFFFCVCVWFLD